MENLYDKLEKAGDWNARLVIISKHFSLEGKLDFLKNDEDYSEKTIKIPVDGKRVSPPSTIEIGFKYLDKNYEDNDMFYSREDYLIYVLGFLIEPSNPTMYLIVYSDGKMGVLGSREIEGVDLRK